MQRTHHCNTKSLYFPTRITDALNNIFNYPLTIVEAPMGYGKTTAVREYLKKSDAAVLWQTIYDSSLLNFWNSLCHQLCIFSESASQSLVRLEFPNDSVSMQEAVHIIENISIPKKTVLVMDDYHLVDSTVVNAFIQFLVRNEISNLHIVLTTRFTQMDNLEELTLKGYLNHLKKEAFELAPNEITEYFKLCGVSIRTSDADRLYAMTDGWISALYLLMLDYISEGSYSHVTNIYKLMEKAVYASFAQEIKDFLVTMCLFDSFTLDQAVHMWGKDNAADILIEITSKNAFIKYDAESKTYHMHSLLTNFLKDVLESKQIKLDLYHKAARWFLKAGDYRLAMHYFYLYGDFEGIYQSIEREKATGINLYYGKELTIKYVVECPDEVKSRHHFVLLLLAFELFTFNEIDLFQKACEEFLHHIHSDKTLDENQRNRLLGEFELIMSFTGYNDIRKMKEHHQKAYQLLKEPSSILSANSNWTFGSPSILYMFYRESGKLMENLEDMMEALPCYSQVSNGNASGGEYIMKAESHFYAGEFDNAEIEAHKAMYESKQKSQVSNIICVLFLWMRLALIQGNFSRITMLLKTMRDEITKQKEYFLIHTVEICEGYLLSLLCQSGKVPEWLLTGDFSSYRLLFPNIPMVNIVYGRILLIKGEYLKLIGSARAFLIMASVFPNLLGSIYTAIYLAAANDRIFRQKDALDALKQALNMAIPDKIYMPFVENGDFLKPLLEELYRQGCLCEEIARILQLYAPYQKALTQIKKEEFSEKKPDLSAREMEIAQLAAEGFSNREIGERLYISENTVKTQMKSVFEKLGINSRVLIKQFFLEKTAPMK